MSDVALLERPPLQPEQLRQARAGRGDSWRVHEIGSHESAKWDHFVQSHPDGTLFHTWNWRTAVAESFPHEPIYLAVLRRGEMAGALPLFFVNSRLFGRMLVSVPYGVGGGILADDAMAVRSLFDSAYHFAEQRRCRCIDLRSERAVLCGTPVTDLYVGFKRQLPSHCDDVSTWIPRKARAAARNAQNKFGVSIRCGSEHLPQVWRLYTQSMRRLASIAYPYCFFERLLARHEGRCWISVAEWDGRPVAGLVAFLFRDTVMPYFMGATEEAKRCSAANLLYLNAMERGVAERFCFFDFGRTRKDNTGAFDFKRFHGFEPRPLQYQCYAMPGHRAPDLSPAQARFSIARRVWRRLPLNITTKLGARVARHVSG